MSILKQFVETLNDYPPTQFKEEKLQEFFLYVWEFYKPKGLYGAFFDRTLKQQELVDAIKRRMSNTVLEFECDSFDRELVRDIIFKMRGEDNCCEHDVSCYF